MPELPDVEVFKRRLDRTALRQTIERVEVKDKDVLDGVSANRLRSSLKGRRLEAARRHGKHLFVQTDKEDVWLAMHFGMTGELTYCQNEEELPKHARVVLHFENDGQLAFVDQRKLGRVSLTNDPDKLIQSKELGPDALGKEMDFARFREAVSSRRSGVKSALMNQAALAGVGNIYSDEILFQARIPPDAKANELDDKQLGRLHRAMRRVLETAIDRQADPGRFPKSWLLAHRDSEGKCPRCGQKLQTSKVSGRTAWFCASCQKST